jgi:hypothetical protein
MALIFLGKTECAICNVVLKEGDQIVATSAFIADRDDPLWQFSDAAMHKSCFLEWDQRKNFVEKYNETVGALTFGNGTYHYMEPDGSIIKRVRERSEF